jgi:hypothetical protein
MSNKPIIYKRDREHKIYIFTAGDSIACIGFNCYAKPNSPDYFDVWRKVGEGDDSDSLVIAEKLFDKKIAELNEAMQAPQVRYGIYDTPTNVHRSMSNANTLLNHLRSRISQRIETNSPTILRLEPDFYMHPHISIEAEIGVVFYHLNESVVYDPERFNRAYWTGLFKSYTDYNKIFTGARDIDPNANAIDIIYPERYDTEKQKLCEYERLYGRLDGAIAESNRAIKAIQQREEQRAALRLRQAQERAEEEARRIFNEEVAQRNEAMATQAAETAAIEEAVVRQTTPWNRVKNTVASLIPITMSMGGKSKRSKRSKGSKGSKRSKGSNRSKRVNRVKRVKRSNKRRK